MNNQRAIDMLTSAINSRIGLQYVYCVDKKKLGISDCKPTKGAYIYINQYTDDVKSKIGEFLELNYTNQY